MSETTIIETPSTGDPISTADLERMLEESRNRATAAERERDEERTTRRQVEQERDHATTAVKSAAELRYTAEVSATDMALTSAKAAAEHAKAAYRSAMEAGDFAAAAEAQEAIADAAAERKQAVQRKSWLETNKDQLTAPPAPPRTETPRQGGKYSHVVGDLLPSEEKWLDAHPEFLADERFRRKVISASQIAGADHGRGTDEYLRRIEEIIGEGRSEARETPRQPSRQQSADLPAGGHRAPGAPAGGSREIRLSADEADIANSLYGNPSTDMYIADEAERFKRYASNRERMKARNA